MEASLEHFVSDVGGRGWFQVYLCLVIFLIKMVGIWGTMIISFGIYDPGWTCLRANDTESTIAQLLPTSDWENVSLPKSNYSVDGDCVVIDSCVKIVFDPEASTVITEWGLICDRHWIASLIISIQMIGMGIGSYLGGYVGDLSGRKTSMYLWVLMSALLNIVGVFSNSWQLFAAIRFLIGISVGGNLSISQVFLTEFVTDKWRMIIAALPMWNTSCLLFGVVIWLLRDWRQIHIATTVLSVLVFLTVFWTPESIRWSVLHGKSHKTMAIARKICKLNGKPRPRDDLFDHLSEISGQDAARVTVRDIFRKGILKRTILSFSIFLITALMYYALGFGIKSLFGNFYTNFMLFSILPSPFGVLVPVFGNKLGRRWGSNVPIIISAILSFIIVVVALTVPREDNGLAITILALTLSVMIDVASGMLIVFIAETFPTAIRMVGFGFALVGGRLGGILAPFLIPRSPDLLFVSYAVMCVLCVLCCVMIMSLPETNKRGLKDRIVMTNNDYREVTQINDQKM